MRLKVLRPPICLNTINDHTIIDTEAVLLAEAFGDVRRLPSRLPGLATGGGTFISPEIGPVPRLFSPASDASTHFSPTSAGVTLRPAPSAAPAPSLALLSPAETPVSDSLPGPPDAASGVLVFVIRNHYVVRYL